MCEALAGFMPPHNIKIKGKCLAAPKFPQNFLNFLRTLQKKGPEEPFQREQNPFFPTEAQALKMGKDFSCPEAIPAS